MAITSGILDWLLAEDNPGVRLRTLRELCGYSENHKDVQNTRKLVVHSLEAARHLSWMSLKGQKILYNLTALAESGLSHKDIDIHRAVEKTLAWIFDCGCGDFMSLRALTMLGYEKDARIKQRLKEMKKAQLPDGGWLCLHRIRMKNKKGIIAAKSCIRAAMHGLLFISELYKKGIKYEGTDQLVDYFLRRRLFFRTDDSSRLVIRKRPGHRMTDVFFPSEVFYVGLPVLLESLATLGAGKAEELETAWRLLDEKKDASGRIILEGTLPLKKAYLPKERVGKPSKWATFYAYSAWGKAL